VPFEPRTLSGFELDTLGLTTKYPLKGSGKEATEAKAMDRSGRKVSYTRTPPNVIGNYNVTRNAVEWQGGCMQ
jgi:hypothetical protein